MRTTRFGEIARVIEEESLDATIITERRAFEEGIRKYQFGRNLLYTVQRLPNSDKSRMV